MAIDDDSEFEGLMIFSTVLIFDSNDEEPKPKKQQFWVRNIAKSSFSWTIPQFS